MRLPHLPATCRHGGSDRPISRPSLEALEPRVLLSGDITITVDPLATSDTTPGLTGAIDDPLADIIVRVNAANYAATNNGDTTWTLADDTVAALDDGAYDVTVIATHGTSFGVDETTGELIVDTTDPVVTVDSLTTKDSTPELTGTIDEPDATVSVNVNGTDYDATNNGDGTWTLADDTIAPALDPNTYDIVVTATDPAGNVGADATTDELTIDPAPVVTVEALTTNQTSPELAGTIDDVDATISVNVNGTDYDATNNGDGTWTLAAGTISPALSDGTYDVVATATGAGGVGTDATTDELVVDTIAPTVTVDPLTTDDSTPALTGTVDDAAATISVNIDGTDYDATNNGDGTWTLADDTIGALTEGTYDVAATATDAAGNVGTDATADELVIDLVPTVTVDDIAANNTSPALTGTVDDPDAVVTITVDGHDYAGVNNQDGTWRIPAGTISPALADGTYDVTATAEDQGGKIGTDATTDELVIDTTAPTVTVDSLTTSDSTPELTGTVDDVDATVVVTVGGSSYTATNNGDGTWTLADDTIAALAEDTYDVSVSATDPAGNVGTDATTDELVVDLLPVVTVDQLVTNESSPELTGTVDDADAEVWINIAGLTLTGAPYQADVDTDGNWTLALGTIAPALVDSTYNVVATAIDTASNEGVDQTTNELTVDTITPTVTVDPLTTDRTSPELTGTIDDPDATVVITVEGTDYTPTNNGDGTWTLAEFTVLNLSSGTHTITALATDAAGNEGTGSTDIEITTDAPVVTVDPLTTTNHSPQLTGTVNDPDVPITVRVAGKYYDAVNNGDGTWTLAIGTISPSLGLTTYDVQVWAQDTIGNYGRDNTLGELTIISEQVVYLSRGMMGVSYRDPDGTRVRITLSDFRGMSSVRLSFASDSVMSTARRGIWPTVIQADAGVLLSSMSILGKTRAISIATGGGRQAGTTIGGITGAADVGRLNARGADLIGDGLNMTGVVTGLMFRSIQADVTMTGVSKRPITISVARNIVDANIRIVNSSIASLMTGSMVNSSVYCGVLGTPDANSDGVYDLPEVANLLGNFKINRILIRGYRGAGNDLFVNSNIACNYIGMAMLRNARLDNVADVDGVQVDRGEFGLAANTIRRLMLRQGRTNHIWPSRWLADPQDLTVRLV